MKKEKAKKKGTAFVALVVLVAMLIGVSPSLCAEPLRIAYTAIGMVSSPVWVTQEAGIFQKYNMQTELVYIAGGQLSAQALIAGDVQIAFTAAGAIVAANLAGADVVLIGTNSDVLPLQLWVVPSIKEPSQLKGTKMGVSRIGGTADFVARYFLKRWGLKPGHDVIIFQTGAGPQTYVALRSGVVQSGVISTGPYTIQTEKEGFVRLADMATMGLPYAYGPFAARRSFLRSRLDLVRRFMKAYVEGMHRFKTDKRLALATLEKYSRLKNSPATEQMYEIFAQTYFKRIPEATAEGIQTALEEIAANRPLPPGTTPQRFVDPRFINEIIESGFASALY